MPTTRPNRKLARPEYLVLDTETTGLPKEYHAPIWDVKNWPRVVQIAWLVYDANATLLDREAFTIRPDGFTIPHDAVKVHGITTEQALRDGISLRAALDCLCGDVVPVSCVVAHNVGFDIPILRAELYRVGMADPLLGKRMICTMESSTDLCRLPGGRGRYKWPRLYELHKFLFKTDQEELHDAAADAEMAARCFWELKRRGVVR